MMAEADRSVDELWGAPSAGAGESLGDDRHHQIVMAAYKILDDDGLDGLTIRAVLARTGLARRAFYERFPGKDELVLAVFEHTISMAAALFRHECAKLSDPLERLRLIVAGIVLGESPGIGGDSAHTQRRSAALSREHLRLAESHPGHLQAALRPLIGLIAELLSEGMRAGLVRDSEPQRLAGLVYNLVATTVHTELLTEASGEPDHRRRAELAADIWEFCRRAIAA